MPRVMLFHLTRIFICVVALLISCRSSAAVQSQPGTSVPTDEPSSRWHLGYDLFQMLLEERGLTPGPQLDAALSAPGDSVIVLLGDLREISRGDWIRMRQFVLDGGALLLATDQSFAAAGFFSGPVTSREFADHYQEFADCIRIRDLDRFHPLTTQTRELVVNGSGWLSEMRDDGLDWTVVARLPARCMPAGSSGRPVVASGTSRRIESGLMVLMADPGLLTNNMLWHGDNAAFVIQLSVSLSAHGRTQLVFAVNGQPLGSYRDNLQPSPAPNPPAPPQKLPEPELATMLKLANTVIEKTQESNVLNELLMNQPRRFSVPRYLRGVLICILTLAAVATIWILSAKSRITAEALPQRPVLSALEMGSSAMGEGARRAAAAEILAADFFRELTGSAVHTDWYRTFQDIVHAPRGSDLRAMWGRSERKQLAAVLEFAVNGRRAHCSRRRFRNIAGIVQILRNRLHLLRAGSPAASTG